METKEGLRHIRIGGGYFLSLYLLILLSLSSAAQAQHAKAKASESQELTSKQRWGIKTNAVDWLFTVPNIGIEYDLGKDTRSKHTLNANLKWNWNTSHKYLPASVFNLFDARMEWRQYFRTRQQNGEKITLKKDGLKGYLRNRIFTTKRYQPRDYRAYYWGVYANYSTYSIKLGKQGKQGTAMGAGISLGYSMPLYGYGSGDDGRRFIDLELGGAIGLLYTKYDVYEYDGESNCYPIIQDKCKAGHLVPFPVVTDVRVAFVYRFMSVKNKYLQTIDGKRRFDIKEAKRTALNEKINLMRVRFDSLQSAFKRRGEEVPDSLIRPEERNEWRKLKIEQQQAAERQAAETLRKHLADSLGIQLTDSLTKQQERQLRQAEEAYRDAQKSKGKKNKQPKVAEGDESPSPDTEAIEEGQSADKKSKKKADKKADKKAEKAEKADKKADKPKKEKKSKKGKVEAIHPEEQSATSPEDAASIPAESVEKPVGTVEEPAGKEEPVEPAAKEEEEEP